MYDNTLCIDSKRTLIIACNNNYRSPRSVLVVKDGFCSITARDVQSERCKISAKTLI